MKRAAIYARVSTPDQRPENQIFDLRKLAAQRGFEIVHEYCDKGISGTKAKRPGLDAMMADARRGEFSVLLVAAFDRLGRSTKKFLELVDELTELGIEFISAREAIDTSGPMGRMFRDVDRVDCRTRTLADYRENPSRNEAGKAGRTAAWTCPTQYRP